VENDERCGAERQQPRHQERDSMYSDFLAIHPLVYADATNPLEADSSLRTMESKFGLLHYIEYQKTAAQQLREGGLPTSPPCMMITMFHGVNSILSSVHTTYLRVCSVAS
jgi:hypothetical protein